MKRTNPDARAPNFHDGSWFVQPGLSYNSTCSYYGRCQRDSNVTVLSAAFYNAQFKCVKLSTHKYFSFDLLRELYYSIVIGGASFERSSVKPLTLECLGKQRYRNKLIFPVPPFLAIKSSCRITIGINSIGAGGLVLFPEPDYIDVLFFLCSAIMRTLPTPRLSFTFCESGLSKDFAGIVLKKFLLDDFTARGISAAHDHACTDCAYKVGEHIVTTFVIDGVTTTGFVCAEKRL